MTSFPPILASSSEDLAVKAIIFVVAIVFWGINSLAKMVKKGAEQQKERMRQVRQSIQADQALRTMTQAPPQIPRAPMQRQSMPRPPMQRQPMQRQPMQRQHPQRPPVQLAPAVAQRVPPPVQPQQRRGQKKRAAQNQNAMAQAQRRPGPAAPPALPTARANDDATLIQPLTEIDPTTPSPTSRKAATVNAVAIKRWLRPMTLRQQFIL